MTADKLPYTVILQFGGRMVKRGRGRPRFPKGTALGRVVPVRFDAEDYVLIQTAAKEAKLPLADWIRHTLRTQSELSTCQGTLHEAIATILKSVPERTASTATIAEEIQRRRLYLRRDGKFPKAQQINARANKYKNLFEWVSSGILRLV